MCLELIIMCFGPAVNETAAAIEDERFLRSIMEFLTDPHNVAHMIAHSAITFGNTLAIVYIYRQLFSKQY